MTHFDDQTQVRHVQLGQLRITCYDSGARPTHDEHRLPLLLVHGTTGSTQAHFSYLFPMLATRQRVISLDLAQPDPTGATPLELEQLTAQVQAVMDELLPGQELTLMGYSLGAVVAASVASLRPNQVRNLVLLAGWMKTDTQQKLRNRVWRQLREEGSQALAAYGAFCAFSGAFLAVRTVEDMLAVASRITTDGFVDQQMDLNTRIDITEQALGIAATTLVIGCTYDQMVPKSHSKQLFGAISDARYAEVASGHAVVFERPAEVFQLVDNFTKNPQAHPAGTQIPPGRP